MITIYSTTTCVYCRIVERYCKGRGIEYQKIELDNLPELRQAITAKTGAVTVPVTTDGITYKVGWGQHVIEFLNKQPRTDQENTHV